MYTSVIVCAALAAIIFAAFEGVRNNKFVFYDDDKYITANEYVQHGLSFESIKWAFTTSYQGNWHPLTWISHLIDISIFSMNPAGHHLVSLGFHIAGVILLFLILRKMTGAIWPSALVAAFYAVHPLSVESVAWAAERKNVLSNFFAFLTIWTYLWYVQKPQLRRYVAVAVLFVAGLLSKSMLVTLPFVLILLDCWPIARFGNLNGQQWLYRSILDKAPLLAISAAFCVITYLAQAHAKAVQDIVSLPFDLRLSNAILSYVRYIGKIFYPVSLAALYPFNADRYLSWKIIICLALLLAVTAAVIIERNRRRFLLTGWLWYLGTLVPVIGLVQVGVQAMADRYAYLPGIGIYIIIVWLAADVSAKLHLPKIIPAITGAVILFVLILITRTQVGYWKDSESLFKHSLDVTADNFVMYSNYGQALKDKGRLDDAIYNFEKALAIRPEWMEVHEKLGIALQAKGRDTEAIEQFAMVLTADPCRVNALNNLYKAGETGGQLDKVLGVILNLQAKNPDNFELYQKAGLIYGVQGKLDAAIEQLEKACRLSDYQAAEPMAFLSQAYASKKDFKRAADMAKKALDAAQKAGRDDIVSQLKPALESYQRVLKDGQ